MNDRDHMTNENRSIERRLDRVEERLDHILGYQHINAKLESIMATLTEVTDQLTAQADATNKLIAQNDVTHQALADLKTQIGNGVPATEADLQAIIDGSKTVTDAINADLAKDPGTPPVPPVV